MKYFRYPILYLLLALLTMVACSDDDTNDSGNRKMRQARVTLLATHNGMGDNGYIDAAVEGIFAFSFQTGTPMQMLLPQDEEEGLRMYNQWIAENADKDSMVLVVGTEAYQTFVKNTPVQLTGKGTRILLFESNITGQPDGVSSIMIDRYGAAYLCGAMSANFDAFIIAAAPGYNTLLDAINGFTDGWNAHHAEGKKLEMAYLSDNESGFAIPDSAYHLISSRINSTSSYREMVFPLLGGSGIGVLQCMNDDESNLGLVIGMDVDQSAICSRIPFSMLVQTGNVVHRYLDEWLQGKDWPKHQTIGMDEGGADVMLHPSFYQHDIALDDSYRDPGTFVRLYNQYRDEAIRKEKEYAAK